MTSSTSVAKASCQPEAWIPTHRHNKTGDLYRLLHDALDVTEDAARAWVVYQNESGEIFTQRATRFYENGRFTDIRRNEGD